MKTSVNNNSSMKMSTFSQAAAGKSLYGGINEQNLE